MNDLEIPKYVLQRNAISQGMYSLSTNARRLIAMAMSKISEDAENYRVEFSVEEFIAALGLSRGSRTNELILAAVEECLDSHIKILHPNGRWEGWTWFTYSALEFEVGDTGEFRDRWQIEKHNERLPSGWDWIVMEFNPALGKAIKEFKGYAAINLLDFGKLQSRYAQRFYELALSYKGFEGKDGNAPGKWRIPYLTLADIRQRFGIPKSKYKVPGNFRTRIIDHPIEEINDPKNDLNVRIEIDYTYRRRRLDGINLKCRWVRRGEPRQINPATESEREAERLIAAYPEEYEKLKAEEMEKQQRQPFLIHAPELLERVVHAHAIVELEKLESQKDRKAKSADRADEIRAYKDEHPEASVRAISEKLGYSLGKISQTLRGR